MQANPKGKIKVGLDFLGPIAQKFVITLDLYDPLTRANMAKHFKTTCSISNSKIVIVADTDIIHKANIIRAETDIIQDIIRYSNEMIYANLYYSYEFCKRLLCVGQNYVG